MDDLDEISFSEGFRCPKCKSDDFVASECFDERTYFHCQNCGKEWIQD